MNVRQGFMVELAVSLEEAVPFAVAHGFDFLELNMENGFARNTVDTSAVRSLVKDAGLDLVVHLPFRLDAGSPHDGVRDGACRELEASIETALEFGATKGVFHAHSIVSPDYWDATVVRDAMLDSIDRVSGFAASRGFEACVENLKGPFLDIGDFPGLLQDASDDMRVCLDTGHAHATDHDVAWQADFIREYGDRISHVHLNDTRRSDADEHIPVGVGMLDFGVLVDAMRDADWSGTCTHEVYAPELGPAALRKTGVRRVARVAALGRFGQASFTTSPRRSTCIASIVCMLMP